MKVSSSSLGVDFYLLISDRNHIQRWMLFKDTVYTQTGIFKGHTNGMCGEGEIRINMKHSMDMLFVSPLSLGVRFSHIHGTSLC